jgi:hypothetical protein
MNSTPMTQPKPQFQNSYPAANRTFQTPVVSRQVQQSAVNRRVQYVPPAKINASLAPIHDSYPTVVFKPDDNEKMQAVAAPLTSPQNSVETDNAKSLSDSDSSVWSCDEGFRFQTTSKIEGWEPFEQQQELKEQLEEDGSTEALSFDDFVARHFKRIKAQVDTEYESAAKSGGSRFSPNDFQQLAVTLVDLQIQREKNLTTLPSSESDVEKTAEDIQVDLDSYITWAAPFVGPKMKNMLWRMYFSVELLKFNSPSQFVFQFNQNDLQTFQDEMK